MPSLTEIAVIAPNLKRRLSGVTATVVRLISSGRAMPDACICTFVQYARPDAVNQLPSQREPWA